MKLSNIQREVLNNLVDRYERRSDYCSGEKSARRTLMRIDQKSRPDYFHVSNSSYRHMFNKEMEALQQQGFVELEWLRFDKGHTLERVVLVAEVLPSIYKLLGRRTKKEIYSKAGEQLSVLRNEAPPDPALLAFFDELMSKLARLEPLPPPLRPEKVEEMTDLLRGLNALCQGHEDDIAKRSLSVKLYGDSKRWQQLEKGILQLYRQFCPVGSEEARGVIEATAMDDSVLLAEQGIVDNPAHIRLAGDLVVQTAKGQIDLSLFEPDLGLPAPMVKEMEIETCPCGAVITIENLTSFYQYLQERPEDHLVIYLGGFANRARRLLLQKLFRFFQEQQKTATFLHWGDMDLGGFKIWYDLVRQTGIPFKPYLMDEETYLQHLQLGQPMSDQYAEKLSALLQDQEYAGFHSLIKLMLEKKIRVEQEAISLQDALDSWTVGKLDRKR